MCNTPTFSNNKVKRKCSATTHHVYEMSTLQDNYLVAVLLFTLYLPEVIESPGRDDLSNVQTLRKIFKMYDLKS